MTVDLSLLFLLQSHDIRAANKKWDKLYEEMFRNGDTDRPLDIIKFPASFLDCYFKKNKGKSNIVLNYP